MTNQGMGLLKMALVLMLLLISGWYLSGLLGALASMLIFLLTVFAASYFICAAYDVPSRKDGFWFMLTFIFGVNYPAITISEGRVSEKSRGTPGAKLGGPGLIKVAQDSAAVVVRGKTSKVIGPGTYVAQRGETVKGAVDLRSQSRTGEVTAMTADRIEIRLNFALGFRIDDGGSPPTPQLPYPFYPQAVRQSVYQSVQVGKDGAQSWDEQVVGAVSGNVRELIATNLLSSFFEQREVLKGQLLANCQSAIINAGVQLKWVSIGTPEILDEAVRRSFDKWRTRQWEAEVQTQDTAVQADRLQTLAKTLREAGLDDETVRAILIKVFAPLPTKFTFTATSE